MAFLALLPFLHQPNCVQTSSLLSKPNTNRPFLHPWLLYHTYSQTTPPLFLFVKKEYPFTLCITPDNNGARVDNRYHNGETFHYLECGFLQREFTVWSEESKLPSMQLERWISNTVYSSIFSIHLLHVMCCLQIESEHDDCWKILACLSSRNGA